MTPESVQTSDAFTRARDAYLKSRGIADPAPRFMKIFGPYVAARTVKTGMFASGKAIDVHGPEFDALRTGVIMETLATQLKAINDEIAESKATMRSLADELHAMSGIIGPDLLAQSIALRDARMAMVRESQQALAALRDVRKFFLESDYETEVARLKDFIALCKGLEAVQASGLLDAVADVMLRLAERRPPA